MRIGALVFVAVLAGCGGGSASGPPPTAAQRLNGEGLRLLERGERPSAEGAFREALAEAELVDDLAGQAEAWNNLGAAATARGDAREAWACHATALRLHRARGVRDLGEVRTRTNLGGAMLTLGDAAGAERELITAAALARSLSNPSAARLAEVGVASCMLTRGASTEAARKARAIAEEARRDADAGSEAAALSIEGAALESTGDLAGARERLTAALEIDRKREQPLTVLGDLLALARIASRSGDDAAASSLHARASRIARRLGQLDLAERELTAAIAAAQKNAPTEAGALRLELEAIRKGRGATE